MGHGRFCLFLVIHQFVRPRGMKRFVKSWRPWSPHPSDKNKDVASAGHPDVCAECGSWRFEHRDDSVCGPEDGLRHGLLLEGLTTPYLGCASFAATWRRISWAAWLPGLSLSASLASRLASPRLPAAKSSRANTRYADAEGFSSSAAWASLRAPAASPVRSRTSARPACAGSEALSQATASWYNRSDSSSSPRERKSRAWVERVWARS